LYDMAVGVPWNEGMVASDFSLSLDEFSGKYKDWLVVSPLGGRVEAGGQAEVTLYYDASLPGAMPGVFKTTLLMRSSDPDRPFMEHHVTLEVVKNLVYVPLVKRS
ncbi:MAG: hypothetical protein ACK2UK_16800, partial [Candidatus Promineifilaceae bacterium]